MNDPRNEAVRRYAAAYDRLAEEEQVAVAQGRYEHAEDCHAGARAAIRAYSAEVEDPDPKPPCGCGTCQRLSVRRTR